jgi:hypothetical protein
MYNLHVRTENTSPISVVQSVWYLLAGLLAHAYTLLYAFPFPNETVASCKETGIYSGGTASDLHRSSLLSVCLYCTYTPTNRIVFFCPSPPWAVKLSLIEVLFYKIIVSHKAISEALFTIFAKKLSAVLETRGTPVREQEL